MTTPESDSGELALCPFCGTAEHLSVSPVGSLTPDMPARPYAVVCRHIDHDDVRGPTAYGKAAAIAAWNRRPTPPVTGEPAAFISAPGLEHLRAGSMQAAMPMSLADVYQRDVGPIHPLYPPSALAAAEQRGREMLDWLAKDACLELSWGMLEDEEGPCAWRVHRRSGNRSDREWTLIGHGDTPAEAIAAAIHGDETGGGNE